MTTIERAMALLERIDPIVGSHTESGSPCGDPMGYETWSVDHRLSELLADGGWASARKNREVSRLLGALFDGGVA